MTVRNPIGCVVAGLLLLTPPQLLAGDVFAAAEFERRRHSVMDQLPEGILLLHAKSSLGSPDQLATDGFHQDPSFYYFTGLANAVSAILAIDGRARESWLFVPPTLAGMAGLVANPYVEAGPESASMLRLDHVVDWNEFIPFLSGRLEADPAPVLYVDDEGAFMFRPLPESNPEGLAPVDDPLLLWRRALEQKWPQATVESASRVVRELRLIKSPAEIEVLTRVARASSMALLAGLRAFEPGKTQRSVEAEIVRECLRAGGEGPSFWPLVATGPNSGIPAYLEGLADYRHANRVMNAGEVTHLDLGCNLDHYGGDVGRTVPVSGRFTTEQREIWNVLVAAYRAGLSAIRDGVSKTDVFEAGRREVARHRSSVQTPKAQQAIEKMLGEGGTEMWFLHTAGVECCETEPDELKAGMVVLFEPSVTVGTEGYYIEDMVLVTETGYRILTEGLPYTADEIEAVMRSSRNR